MKNIIQPLKGTRDFYPEEMARRNWLYAQLRTVSESFGYQEYEGPFLEPIELYAAKSGEELVKEQSFVFPDRGGNLITLRPELTPSLVRMIAQRQKALVYPLRWWSWGPMWRYERPQKGRSREFFQWNIDLVGVDSPQADAELVAVIAEFFRTVRLTPKEAMVLVNNRRLMDKELSDLDIPAEERPNVSRWIDRRDKMSPADWAAYGKDIGLSPRQVAGVQSILSNDQLWQKSSELVEFFETLDAMGVGEYVRFDPNIVRGLDYYTGTVFEAVEVGGEIRRAILGGGRYDNLMADVGGDPLPGVGFAMGDVVITLILEKYGCLPEGLGASPASVLVTVFDEAGLLPSLALAADLRLAGLNVVCYPEAARLAKQFKFADRTGVRLAAVLGPEEQQNNQVTIKDLKSGAQETIPNVEAAERIRQMLDFRPAQDSAK
jgi:histidyl-tRNA synthetase